MHEQEVLWRDGKITLEDILGEKLDEFLAKEKLRSETQDDFPVPDGIKKMRDGWYARPDRAATAMLCEGRHSLVRGSRGCAKRLKGVDRYDEEDEDSREQAAREGWEAETRSCGEPPHGSAWMLFNGSRFRSAAMFGHPAKPDEVRLHLPPGRRGALLMPCGGGRRSSCGITRGT